MGVKPKTPSKDKLKKRTSEDARSSKAKIKNPKTEARKARQSKSGKRKSDEAAELAEAIGPLVQEGNTSSGREYVESEREPCDIEAPIHSKYQTRIRMKTESELALERARAKMPVTDQKRNERAERLRNTHSYIMAIASFYLNVTPKEVEDGVLDEDEHVDLLEDFCIKGGRYSIVFTFKTQYILQVDSVTERTVEYIKRSVIVADGACKIESYCCVVIRVRNDFQLEGKLLYDEVFFNGYSLDDITTTVASGLANIFCYVTGQTVERLANWNALSQGREQKKTVKFFKEDIKDFVEYFAATKLALDSVVKFPVPDDFFNNYVKDEEAMEACKAENEKLIYVETMMSTWLNLIEQTLTYSEKLVGELGELPPNSSLDYWRHQTAVFCSISEFVESKLFLNTLDLLESIKSYVLPRWYDLEERAFNIKVVAKEHLKYFTEARRFWAPVTRCGPLTVAKHIPCVLYALRMAHANSAVLHSPRRMACILLKITNAMLRNCILYLTHNETISIWEQDKMKIISKIEVCMRLHKEYHSAYQRTLEDIDDCFEETSFGSSKNFIFGKMDKFKIRLLTIKDFLNKQIKYSVLERRKMDGLEEHRLRFQKLFNNILSKKYDPLDHRNLDFNKDYDAFLSDLKDAEAKLKVFMYSKLAELPDIDLILQNIFRFETMNLECLECEKAYFYILEMFLHELEELRNMYNLQRDSPILTKFAPDLTARIMWVRGLAWLARGPMEIIRTKECIKTSPISQKLIKFYNGLLTAFIYYEHIFHQEFFKRLTFDSLRVPVLYYDADNDTMDINFDKKLLETFTEIECFLHLRLHVSTSAAIYYYLKPRVVSRYVTLKIQLDRYHRIVESIPTLFTNILQPYMSKAREVFEPCLSMITWSSLNGDLLLAAIESVLQEAEVFIKEISDMREARIEDELEKLSKTMLVYIHPANLDHKEYLKRNVYYQMKILRKIMVMSYNAETATIVLVKKIVEGTQSNEIDDIEKHNWFDPEKVRLKSGSQIDLSTGRRDSDDIRIRRDSMNTNDFKNDCMDLFNYFHQKFTNSLVRATTYTLQRLRARTNVSLMTKGKRPMLVSNILLEVPRILERPSLNEMQGILNSIVGGALKISQNLKPWGVEEVKSKPRVITENRTDMANMLAPTITFVGNPEYENLGDIDDLVAELPKASELERELNSKGVVTVTYFKAVNQHKEVMRHVAALQDVFSGIGADVQKLVERYYNYRDLWEDDKKEVIDEFAETEPIPPRIREKFVYYHDAAADISEIQDTVIIGPLEFDQRPLKNTLLIECQLWTEALGDKFANFYHWKLREFMQFIDEHVVILNHEVKDLDDCRNAMACLEEVRDSFVEMDWQVECFEEVFFIFHQFGVNTLGNDADLIDGLRFNYDSLLNLAVNVQALLCSLQKPLREELMNGISELKRQVEQFDQDFIEHGPMVPGLPAKEASDRVLLFQDRFDNLWKKYETYASGETLFGMGVTEYPILNERKKQFNLLQKLYGLYLLVNKTIDSYYDIVWNRINIELIMSDLADYQNRCRKLPRGMKDWPAFIDLKKKIDDFNECCPMIEMMSNKAMKERHWIRLEKLLGCKFNIDDEHFTLRNIMEAPLLKYKEDVEDICMSAVKEKDIEFKLKQVIADWAVVDLQFSTFKNKGELLLKGTETAEVIAQLEDSLMILNSLATNRFNAYFKKDIMMWVSNLSTTGEILEQWLLVQNLWIYLEAVFCGGDISKQLPQEAKRFSMIDKSWLKIMQRAREMVNVIDVCVGDDTMKSLLPYLLEQLEACQKSLTGYLEQKRLIFPRFFFVSDPSLLEILGQASDSHTIQAHLLNVFENVATVEFDERERDRILAIISREGETILLDHTVLCVGGVEYWLGSLLDSSKMALNVIIGQVWDFLNDPDFRIIAMANKFPSQVGLVGLQMLWTRDSEKAMRESKDEPKVMKQTNKYFISVLNTLIDMTAKNLAKFERVKFETLITIHVHQRDIFENLYLLEVSSPEDFEWLKQERFYYEEEQEYCSVKITDVNFIYQNEFLGCSDRLVITPLTDKCYITLAQSVGMHLGGAPAGPAGTGKTETTKDMGKSLGKYVVVFNCSDQMDFRGLGRIFKGLAQSGSWGCFDEFNRIELPVLSVAAQQINIVFTASKEKKSIFLFSDGDMVTLNQEFGIFITMNPGYAGRQELPENLKIMFRTVAMMVPDKHIIIRVKMASCGFRENIPLSRKFYILYMLCEEQLSKQVHYDFGLRNILSVLRTMGAQKRANPKETEETVLMRVLRDMNASKLVDEDEPLFVALVDDLFVGQKLTAYVYKDLARGVTNQCKEQILTNHAPWAIKIIQLYETSLVRHGLMTMGPTGSGKTCCINVLLASLTETGKPHREMRMNPKAITAPQMFGRLDVATNDWTDGIFSTLWRRSLKVKKTDSVWIVLDGPVDAVWIENLNSVLDDNKTLTLANGDRIVMAANAKLVFEPDNVDNASPATVSRMGMVFLSSSVLTWEPIVEAWFRKRKPFEVEVLRPLFHKLYNDAYVFLETKLIAKMKILEALYIRQCIDLLIGLMDTFIEATEEEEAAAEPVVELEMTEQRLEKLFLFALMWSLGTVLELDQRDRLQHFLMEHPSKLPWPVLMDETERIFEFYVNEEGEWSHWNKRVDEFFYPTNEVLEFASILVPNVDNVRMLFLIDTIAKQHKAVLLIGEQGTAKTVMIKSYMSKYNPEIHLSKSLNFSSATTPNMVQRIIESYVDKRVGTTYGPPNNRKMTVFIDDINMPDFNSWGDQPTNEITRQLMEQGGFYSLDKPGEFLNLVDIQFMAAMIHPGGGRNDIPPRLKRRFNIFNCTLPSDKSMDKIFSKIGEGYFCHERFKSSIVEFVPMLVPMTRLLWQRTKIKMLPTPAKFHYIFNLRDLSRIWEGILTIEDAELQNVTVLLKLWKHECLRVISDRFTNEDDKNWFERQTNEVAMDYLPPHLSPFYDSSETYFVDFLRDPPDPTGDEPEDFLFEAPKIYEEMPSYEFVAEKLMFYMSGYNDEYSKFKHLDMVFFKDCMVHLIKISRVIETPRGSIMLVGVGGSGKRALTYLSSFISNYSFFSITLTRIYNVSNFMDDLKYLYRIAGGQNHGISFIFTDNDIKDESFLEFLNNILSSGEVANLFAKDEMDEMLNDIIPVMKKIQPRRLATMDNLYDFFITQARKNLHVVLCFSPVNEKFRSRSMKFPGLISGCTIDWFSKWPRDALVAVANHIIGGFNIVCEPGIKDRLIGLMGEIHDGISDLCNKYFDRYRRRTYVTPKSFLSYIQGYKEIYALRNADISLQTVQMSTGLKKLLEAAESVGVLKVELVEKEKEILIASEKTDVVLREVKIKTELAEAVKADVKVVVERASQIASHIAKDKVVAEKKLEAARPALEAAEAALLTITSADIATVRKLGKPPYLITLIMDAVLILFQRKMPQAKPDVERKFFFTNWAESLRVMADTRFLLNLQQFPRDTINGEMVDLLTPYFNYPSYNYAAAKQACGNVAGLLSWTIAMGDFYAVNKDVLPMKANLAMQLHKLSVAQKELHEAQSLLRAKEEELAAVNMLLNEALKEKKAVQDVADRCQARMDAATALLSGLSGEQSRWTEQLAIFKSETDRLIGDVLVLTGFLSYCGPFNQEFRLLMQSSWYQALTRNKIPITDNLNIVENLVDPPTIGEWNLAGLPTDELSIQNGIIVTKASRFPLLIDPQSQGVKWIKNMEKNNKLTITSLNHKYFRNHLEDALGNGTPLLIEDVLEELDPVLDNVLEKNYIKSGYTFKVKLSDKEVDVIKTFKVYITTKLANPMYTPEVSAKTSIIDFTVTMKGLEDQLLGRVILTEKRELEDERTALLTDVTFNKRKMKELEANLLYKLTTVKGSLVDDETVLQVLNVTKDTASSVRLKLKNAAITEVKINTAREEFRPVAARGSVLYFLVVEMAMVNYMYQTSLVQFLERFDVSLDRSEKHQVTGRRINAIIEYLTYEVYRYKCRGLYEKHKYLFALLLALKVDLQQSRINHTEFDYFIKGGGALDLNNVAPKPNFRWLTDIAWLNLVQLSSVPGFSGITDQVRTNDRAWKFWFEKPAPEDEVIPDDYDKFDVFKKMLLIRALCPDRVISQSKKYIAASLSEKFVQPLLLNLVTMLEESRPFTPLICFLSMGSDPTPMIETMAKRTETLLKSISMGQGQEIHARKIMSLLMAQGGWVLLQNCHLGLEYMSELFLLLQEGTPVDPDFRLWITTEPHDSFPINLLQICIKYTFEPPQGLSAGLMRTYSAMSQDFVDFSNNPNYLPLIYAVSFLHSVVQERRKFGPLGWNIPYEFNFSDWNASTMFVQNHLEALEKGQEISWITVRYMLSEVQYGGRVTDDFDKRLLTTFTKVWFNETMMNPDFMFYKGYRIMKYKNLNQYWEAIAELPATDPPQVFGLHPNANITFQASSAQDVLTTIINIQPKAAGASGGESRESVVTRQAKEMLSKVPADYDPFDVKERLRVMGHLNPLNIFLRQELDRMQKVVFLVRKTLKELLLAIEGTIIMNEALRDALDNIYDARVPQTWKRGSWQSSSIGFWFTELLERSIQFNSWIYKGRPNQFWMTGFFNPQGFLTAMRQEIARAHKGWSLETVVIMNYVTKLVKEQVKTPPVEGVLVYGLYLEGAGWDRRSDRLAESAMKVLYVMMPVIHITAINAATPKDMYICPVYNRPQRTGLNYITSLFLPCKLTPDHWVIRGVALLCDIK